jgi:NADPH-dependent glutamate synthase beta subunit-like oxidoreductase
MPKLVIDNRQVEAAQGATILDAASRLGIEIPTMCYLTGCTPATSCMICVVKVQGLPKLVPACGTIAEDGMRIETNSEQIIKARKTALELLLSDHVGDCMGPCQIGCPAGMNIPLMLRQIVAGKLRDAIVTIKADIALPAVLGRICAAPCEKVCRRAAHDQPVSICLLKRYVADVDLASANPYLPACESANGKSVAVVGAGPAGLAAAYYLLQKGYACVLFDDHEKPGGMLRYAVSERELPRDVLDAEIALIQKLGATFRLNTKIGDGLGLDDLQTEFYAVFIAVGKLRQDDTEPFGLLTGPNGILVEGKTYQTNLPGVFAGGDAVRSRKLTVRAVADGKEAAQAIHQYLSKMPVTGPTAVFNTRIGKLREGEITKFMALADKSPRTEPKDARGGLTEEQALTQAARCLHCDCRKADNCKLRMYCRQYQARPARYKNERRLFEQYLQHRDLIYEPAKCIDCGLCVQITAKETETLGLTFVGRGFDIQVAVPFDRSLDQALTHTANKCVNACPTAALAFR